MSSPDEIPHTGLDAYYRSVERDTIDECLKSFPMFDTLPRGLRKDLVKQLEIGCNNATFDKIVKRKLPQIWDDPRYVEQYSNVGFHLNINLDMNSSINQALPPRSRSHFHHLLYNHQIKKWLSVFGREGDPDLPWDHLLSYLPSIDPKTAAYLSGQEINPYSSQQYLDEISIREKQTIDKKVSKMYKCPRCGERKTTYVSVQSRGLDEDNTLYITCQECSFSWKKN